MTIVPKIRGAAAINQWHGEVVMQYPQPRFRQLRLWSGPARTTEAAAWADARATAARLNTQPRDLV